MGAIKAAVDTAFRDYVSDGVPASGAHEPRKSEIRYALGDVLENTLATVGDGLRRFATRALLNAATGNAGDLAYVYNDSTASNNNFYQRVGSSWVVATWYLTAAVDATTAKVDASKMRVALGPQAFASGGGTGNENTAIGFAAGSGVTGGTQNLFVGAYSGQLSTTINYVTAIGRGALINNLGDGCTALGANAGNKINNAAADNNTFLGYAAGAGDDQKVDAVGTLAIGAGANTTKNYQAVIGGADISETVLRGRVVMNGLNTLRMDDQANDNTYGLGGGPAGDSTGSISGTGNLALGKFALAAKNSNISCVALGFMALNASDTGIDHTAVGVGAAQSQRGGVGCTAVGREAGFRSVNGTNWTALGDTSLRDNLADLNVGVGYGAARDNTTGSVLAVGTYAAGYTKTALRVTAIGTESFGGQGHGDDNTGVGYRAGSVMLGARNSVFGSESLLLAGTFNDVTALGYRAGFTTTGGSKNTFVGSNAGKDSSQKVQPVNSMALGADSFTTKDNQVVLGSAAVTETIVRGVVKGTAMTVSALPAAAAEYLGARAFVTDAISATFAAVVAGGGGNKVPVYCDGAAWRVG